MLQYIVIMLGKQSVSFCYHAQHTDTDVDLIPLETLKSAIIFAMKENLNIQFVYPPYELPEEYLTAIDTIDHSNIMPQGLLGFSDVVVLNGINDAVEEGKTVVLRLTLKELEDSVDTVKSLLSKVPRVNIMLTDITQFKEHDFDQYQAILDVLVTEMATLYFQGSVVQLNVLTDRLLLDKMNNCGAGDTSVTLAPNGRFYVCPAFYYDAPESDIGNLSDGLHVRNPQLYKLDHAPLCRWCDAYQCRRCVWLNYKQTMDVNTPSHEQCVVAHIERNATRKLLGLLQERGMATNLADIKEIDYLDPINIFEQWKLEKLWGK